MKMKKLLFVSLLTMAGHLAQAQIPSLQEGIKHLENENFTAALNTFTAIAKNDPKNGTIYYYIGEVSYLTDEFAEAEKSYKKGLSINPQCAECKTGLGKLMMDQDKMAEAEEYFESASRLDKKNPEIFAMIGDAYLYGKKPNAGKAVTNLSMARDMNPKVAKYWAHLGDAYKLQGNNGEAMTSYEEAIAKDPTNTAAYISMARIWTNAKQLDLAIPMLQEAIKLSPNDAQPYKELIELYIKSGEYEKVTPLLEKYVSLTGTDVDAKVRLVKFLTFQAKDYGRAVIEGEKLLETNPEQYTLHRWLAWSYGETGEYQHSHDHSGMLFEEIGKKEGRAAFPSDYDYWGKASFKLGLLDEAAHIYRKYLELDPSRTQEIYGQLAKAYLDAKNYPQAIAYYNRKGAEKPLSVADQYYLGIAQYYNDLDLQADTSFAKVLTITPDYAPAWIMRARIANRIDSGEIKLNLAKDYYENYITYAIKDKEKNKKNLIEASNYLSQYWVYREDDAVAKAQVESKLNQVFNHNEWVDYCHDKAIEYYELILSLDPADEVAAFNLKLLKEQR